MTRDGLLTLVRWNPTYRPEWNDDPWSYIEAGLVQPNKSRRLGKVNEPRRTFQAYLGVQYSDPPASSSDAAYCRFFVSLWFRGRVAVLQTHPTIDAAIDQMWSFYESLPPDRTPPQLSR